MYCELTIIAAVAAAVPAEVPYPNSVVTLTMTIWGCLLCGVYALAIWLWRCRKGRTLSEEWEFLAACCLPATIWVGVIVAVFVPRGWSRQWPSLADWLLIFFMTAGTVVATKTYRSAWQKLVAALLCLLLPGLAWCMGRGTAGILAVEGAHSRFLLALFLLIWLACFTSAFTTLAVVLTREETVAAHPNSSPVAEGGRENSKDSGEGKARP